jgi:hypothetical protein
MNTVNPMNSVPAAADKLNQQVRLSIGDLHIQIVGLQLALAEARAEISRLEQLVPAPKKEADIEEVRSAESSDKVAAKQ